jgi:glutathione S-transferase
VTLGLSAPTDPTRITAPVAAPTLYVIPGSHACRSAMLMLDHKRIAYRRVDLHTGLHPLSVRMRGFPGHRTPIRSVDGDTHASLAALDRAGTVPALRYRDRWVQTNHEIARFLERQQPEPPLFPSDPRQREQVEQAERWGDEILQMAARRLGLLGAAHGLDTMYRRGNEGRLGALLAPGERMRLFQSRGAAFFFRANEHSERELLDELPGMLDKVDAWIDAGVLDAAALNAADFMIVPSLALLAYRNDLRGEIEARPAGRLVERVLPEPAV